MSPVLKIVATEAKMPNGDYSMIIITSASALQVIEQQDFDQSLLNITLYVVGDKTAKKARDFGFKNVHSAAGNANSLVELIKSRFDISARTKTPALYICGEHSTSGFIDALQISGLNIKTWINYKANLVDQLTYKSIDFLTSGDPVGILLYSARSATQFSGLIDQLKITYNIDNMSIFALSSTIQNALSKDLKKATKIAQKPDEKSLFALIPS